MSDDRMDIRYLECRLALDFLSRHGRPPRNAAVQWERVFNALHKYISPITMRAIDDLLTEYATETALRQEYERLRRAINEPQTAYVEIVNFSALENT